MSSSSRASSASSASSASTLSVTGTTAAIRRRTDVMDLQQLENAIREHLMSRYTTANDRRRVVGKLFERAMQHHHQNESTASVGKGKEPTPRTDRSNGHWRPPSGKMNTDRLSLNRSQFKYFLNLLHFHLHSRQVDALFHACDRHNDGIVTCRGFLDTVLPVHGVDVVRWSEFSDAVRVSDVDAFHTVSSVEDLEATLKAKLEKRVKRITDFFALLYHLGLMAQHENKPKQMHLSVMDFKRLAEEVGMPTTMQEATLLYERLKQPEHKELYLYDLVLALAPARDTGLLHDHKKNIGYATPPWATGGALGGDDTDETQADDAIDMTPEEMRKAEMQLKEKALWRVKRANDLYMELYKMGMWSSPDHTQHSKHVITLPEFRKICDALHAGLTAHQAQQLFNKYKNPATGGISVDALVNIILTEEVSTLRHDDTHLPSAMVDHLAGAAVPTDEDHRKGQRKHFPNQAADHVVFNDFGDDNKQSNERKTPDSKATDDVTSLDLSKLTVNDNTTGPASPSKDKSKKSSRKPHRHFDTGVTAAKNRASVRTRSPRKKLGQARYTPRYNERQRERALSPNKRSRTSNADMRSTWMSSSPGIAALQHGSPSPTATRTSRRNRRAGARTSAAPTSPTYRLAGNGPVVSTHGASSFHD